MSTQIRSRVFWVGEHRVDPADGRVERAGEVVRLEPKTMDVLVKLAEQRGSVVTRHQLQEEVWGKEFVSDDALNRTIGQIRRLFGDDSQDPRYVETIPKRGYRLVAPVRWDGVEGVAPDVELPKGPAPVPASSLHWWRAVAEGRVEADLTSEIWGALVGEMNASAREEGLTGSDMNTCWWHHAAGSLMPTAGTFSVTLRARPLGRGRTLLQLDAVPSGFPLGDLFLLVGIPAFAFVLAALAVSGHGLTFGLGLAITLAIAFIGVAAAATIVTKRRAGVEAALSGLLDRLEAAPGRVPSQGDQRSSSALRPYS